jgi:hypothetical protein
MTYTPRVPVNEGFFSGFSGASVAATSQLAGWTGTRDVVRADAPQTEDKKRR